MACPEGDRVKKCRECKKAEVPDNEGTVCKTCRPVVRARRVPIDEMLRRIDATLEVSDVSAERSLR